MSREPRFRSARCAPTAGGWRRPSLSSFSPVSSPRHVGGIPQLGLLRRSLHLAVFLALPDRQLPHRGRARGGIWPWSPALLILAFPLGLRLTCYDYRKAYYRSFWQSPPACTVAEPHKRYTGETRFPLILQNVHRSSSTSRSRSRGSCSTTGSARSTSRVGSVSARGRLSCSRHQRPPKPAQGGGRHRAVQHHEVLHSGPPSLPTPELGSFNGAIGPLKLPNSAVGRRVAHRGRVGQSVRLGLTVQQHGRVIRNVGLHVPRCPLVTPGRRPRRQ